MLRLTCSRVTAGKRAVARAPATAASSSTAMFVTASRASGISCTLSQQFGVSSSVSIKAPTTVSASAATRQLPWELGNATPNVTPGILKTSDFFVEVASRGSAGRGLVAKKRIFPGMCILKMNGRLQREPGQYTVQVGTNLHFGPNPDVFDKILSPHGEVDFTKLPVDGMWMLLNHHCNPNSIIDVKTKTVVARKIIEAGEEINFSYNTTEYDMAVPFECHCPEHTNPRLISGYKHASAAEKHSLADIVSPHLRSS